MIDRLHRQLQSQSLACTAPMGLVADESRYRPCRYGAPLVTRPHRCGEGLLAGDRWGASMGKSAEDSSAETLRARGTRVMNGEHRSSRRHGNRPRPRATDDNATSDQADGIPARADVGPGGPYAPASSGWAQRRLRNRAKARSALYQVAPFSTAIAA